MSVPYLVADLLLILLPVTSAATAEEDDGNNDEDQENSNYGSCNDACSVGGYTTTRRERFGVLVKVAIICLYLTVCFQQRPQNTVLGYFLNNRGALSGAPFFFFFLQKTKVERSLAFLQYNSHQCHSSNCPANRVHIMFRAFKDEDETEVSGQYLYMTVPAV